LYVGFGGDMKVVSRLVLLFTSILGISTGAFGTIPRCGVWVSGRPFEVVAKDLHGGEQNFPTAQSTLGNYLRKSGAETRLIRFDNGEGGQGFKKLVVLVSPATFPLFSQLFGKKNPNLLEHLHTPNQGTLMMRWMTETFSYASPHGEWRFPTVGSLGPMILLSDTEAARLEKYWKLNKDGQTMCRHPNEIPGYNYPPDAYINNCTAWIGHLPIGDETLSRASAAGSVDNYGDGGGRRQRSRTLRSYVPPDELTAREAQLMAEVWGAPVHERLWDLLRIPFGKANHTNPGWVATSLTAVAKHERVPFVALYVDDATKFPEPFDPQIHRVGN
jgi:hypothetical protein